jgi:hypothetical protein
MTGPEGLDTPQKCHSGTKKSSTTSVEQSFLRGVPGIQYGTCTADRRRTNGVVPLNGWLTNECTAFLASSLAWRIRVLQMEQTQLTALRGCSRPASVSCFACF